MRLPLVRGLRGQAVDLSLTQLVDLGQREGQDGRDKDEAQGGEPSRDFAEGEEGEGGLSRQEDVLAGDKAVGEGCVVGVGWRRGRGEKRRRERERREVGRR